jgi:hypothetical protein
MRWCELHKLYFTGFIPFCMITRSTAIAVKPRSQASSVKERTRGLKRWLEADEQEEVKNKFVTNMPKLLLEVSFSQFRFFACCLKFSLRRLPHACFDSEMLLVQQCTPYVIGPRISFAQVRSLLSNN